MLRFGMAIRLGKDMENSPDAAWRRTPNAWGTGANAHILNDPDAGFVVVDGLVGVAVAVKALDQVEYGLGSGRLSFGWHEEVLQSDSYRSVVRWQCRGRFGAGLF